MIRLLHLDDPEMNRFRGRLIRLIRHLWNDREKKEVAASLYGELMGYPNDLPNLSMLRPRDNARPEGIRYSHFERRKRGELPEVY
jgi:hypothetical protein